MVVYPHGTYKQLYAGWGLKMVRADIIPPSPWGYYFHLIDIAILYFAIFAFFCEYSNIVFILNPPAETTVLSPPPITQRWISLLISNTIL